MDNQYTPEFKEQWSAVEAMLTERFGSVPDMEGILYLIGINELQNNDPNRRFSRDEKQDLIHVAICTLLQKEGYYRFVKYDDDGWPHFEKERELNYATPFEQEEMLKKAMIQYFDL